MEPKWGSKTNIIQTHKLITNFKSQEWKLDYAVPYRQWYSNSCIWYSHDLSKFKISPGPCPTGGGGDGSRGGYRVFPTGQKVWHHLHRDVVHLSDFNTHSDGADLLSAHSAGLTAPAADSSDLDVYGDKQRTVKDNRKKSCFSSPDEMMTTLVVIGNTDWLTTDNSTAVAV